MAIYGYHRISTKEQHTDRGVMEIEGYCDRAGLKLSGDVFCDKMTGKKFDRPEYNFIKNRILAGDTLIITEMDRLGRNKAQILLELQFFRDMGVQVIILEIPTTQIDYSAMDSNMAKMIMEAVNNLLVEMYAVFAQAEIEKKEKRQREGIETKKLRGEWDDYGRPRAIDQKVFDAHFERVTAGELTPTQLRTELKLTHATFYRYRATYFKSRPMIKNQKEPAP